MRLLLEPFMGECPLGSPAWLDLTDVGIGGDRVASSGALVVGGGNGGRCSPLSPGARVAQLPCL